MPMARKKRILVAPLNWGLGHASRCIPIIRKLREHSAEVVLGADGRPYDFLKNEFPDIELHRLHDIDIRYADGSSMLKSMLRQTPHIVSSFFRERMTLNRMIGQWNIDGIISDNRFGLYTPSLPCIYLTHQIGIMAPPAFSWLDPLLGSAHASIIGRFTECWIPDNGGNENLSGDLSHGLPLPPHTHFIGPLSRFSTRAKPEGTYDLAVVLSGPEPQRTIFENIVRAQLRTTTLRVIIVQGIPERQDTSHLSETVEIVSSLNAARLNGVLLGSHIIVSRSGYSSVMDIAALGKKAIFVPTPGQTEQEYIAARLSKMNIYYSETQSAFDLVRALERSSSYTGWQHHSQHDNVLEERINHFLSIIRL